MSQSRLPIAVAHMHCSNIRVLATGAEIILMPSGGEVLRLYRTFLKEGRKFPNYNIREYVRRQVQERFRERPSDATNGMSEERWAKAKTDLSMVQRQATVYTLFARKHKSIMDMPLERVLAPPPPPLPNGA